MKRILPGHQAPGYKSHFYLHLLSSHFIWCEMKGRNGVCLQGFETKDYLLQNYEIIAIIDRFKWDGM